RLLQRAAAARAARPAAAARARAPVAAAPPTAVPLPQAGRALALPASSPPRSSTAGTPVPSQTAALDATPRIRRAWGPHSAGSPPPRSHPATPARAASRSSLAVSPLLDARSVSSLQEWWGREQTTP